MHLWYISYLTACCQLENYGCTMKDNWGNGSKNKYRDLEAALNFSSSTEATRDLKVESNTATPCSSSWCFPTAAHKHHLPLLVLVEILEARASFQILLILFWFCIMPSLCSSPLLPSSLLSSFLLFFLLLVALVLPPSLSPSTAPVLPESPVQRAGARSAPGRYRITGWFGLKGTLGII